MIKWFVSLCKRITSDPILKQCIFHFILLNTALFAAIYFLPDKFWNEPTTFIDSVLARPWLILLLLLITYDYAKKEYYQEKEYQESRQTENKQSD